MDAYENPQPGTMAYAFLHPEIIDAAIANAYAEVARRHKSLGLPLVVQRGDRIMLIPPEEILAPTV